MDMPSARDNSGEENSKMPPTNPMISVPWRYSSDYVTLHGKKDFSNVIWINYLINLD